MTPRVFTIPASAPFLPTLIEALTSGKLGFAMPRDPLALASATLYLPTRRACRLAHDAFLDVLKADAAILPRIVPLGDIDEDEIAFAEAATGGLAADALALPQALGGTRTPAAADATHREMGESPELHGASGAPLVAQTPAAACALADDLARLIDDMTTRGVRGTGWTNSCRSNFDEYLAAHAAVSADRARSVAGRCCDEHRTAIEPAERARRADQGRSRAPCHARRGPVIAAGSTGSIPATAELIATIARLPHGAVVLPGLDTDLDEASWRLIAGDKKKTNCRPLRPIRNSPCRRC